MHTLFKTARHKGRRLLHAPYDKEVEEVRDRHGQMPKILDLGCGTGIWMLEMAEKFQRTHFYGVDLHPLGPEVILANIDIDVPHDFETPWSWGEESFDVIHLQMGLGSVQNWQNLFAKIRRNLRPASPHAPPKAAGWFESVEMDWEPRCDDGTLPENGALRNWWNHVSRAYAEVHRPLQHNPHMKEDLEATGFRGVEEVVYKVPLNGWPQEDIPHRLGMWWQITMSAGGGDGSSFQGLEALSLAVLTRTWGWPPEHARRLVHEALEEAGNFNVHAYNNLHVVWARTPFPHEIERRAEM